MSYLYFPGCSLRSTGRPYEESILAVFKKLDIPLTELEDWNCCGATAYVSIDENRAFTLAARNLALAERMQANGNAGQDLMAPCSACYLVLEKTQHYMKTDAGVNHEVTEALHRGGFDYKGTAKVRHPLDILVNDIGIERITKAVVRPMKGMKVACYYGCLLTRPPNIVAFDDAEHTSCMDELLTAIGAEPVEWPFKTECCGASLSITRSEIVNRLSHRLLSMARQAGAQCLAVACPLCESNLDLRQADAAKAHGPIPDTPVLYITQLLGLALGLSSGDVGLEALTVSAEPLLAGIGRDL